MSRSPGPGRPGSTMGAGIRRGGGIRPEAVHARFLDPPLPDEPRDRWAFYDLRQGDGKPRVWSIDGTDRIAGHSRICVDAVYWALYQQLRS